MRGKESGCCKWFTRCFKRICGTPNTKNCERVVQVCVKAQDLVNLLEEYIAAVTKQACNKAEITIDTIEEATIPMRLCSRDKIVDAEQIVERARVEKATQMLEEAALAPYTSCCNCWSLTELRLSAKLEPVETPEFPEFLEEPEEDVIMTTVFSHGLKLKEDLKTREETAPKVYLKERLSEAKARLKVLSTKASDTHDDDTIKLTFMLPAEEQKKLVQQLKKDNEEGFKEVEPF